MSRSIGEEAAWRLVLATPPGPDAPSGVASISVRDEGDSAGHSRLRVDSSGRWEAVAPVSREAREIFDLYLPLRVRGRWAIGQLGQSLDGRIATEAGHSHYITGPEDLRRLHRVRALADAVVVGAGTVAADDPRLTVREVPGESPVRVILDPEERLAPGHAVFQDEAAPTLVFRSGARSGDPPARPMTEVVSLPGRRFDPRAVVAVLRDRGLERILVEGGGVTVSGFLSAGVLDRLHVTVAPLLIGSGRPAFVLDPIQTLDRALRPTCRHFHLGEDVLFDLDLRATAPRAESENPGSHSKEGE